MTKSKPKDFVHSGKEYLGSVYYFTDLVNRVNYDYNKDNSFYKYLKRLSEESMEYSIKKLKLVFSRQNE